MDVSVEIRPPFLPTAWRAWNRDNRNRLLAVSDSQTSAEAGPKMLHFPAHFVIVDFPKQPVLLVATCIYGVALAALLFLICMRPCLANLSSLPPTFWLVQPVMWCQLLFVLGFSSTSFRGFLDSLLPSLARTSFAYFGTSIDFPLLSHIAHKDVANAYYAGKYTTTGDSPYLLETIILPVLLYFISWLASLITRGAVKEIAVHVRLAVGCGYGVQFAFMAGLTCVSFFNAGVYIAYTTVGVAIAILLLCLLTFDLLSLRLQYSWRKSFRSLTPSTRGVLVFDTPCSVDPKNDRPAGDVSALGDNSTPNTTTLPVEPVSIGTIRLPVSEPALYFLMALLLGLLGRSFVVQSILLLILTLVLIAGRALSRQTSKCLVLAQYSVFLLLAILHLVFDSLSESTPVKTIEFLSYIYLVVYCGALFLFLVDFVCRCFRLAKLVKGVRSSYVDIDAGDRSVNSSTREISKLTIRATSEALNKSFPTTQVEESAQRETKKRSNINVYRDAGLRTIEGSLLNGPNTPSKLIVSPSDSSKMPIPSKNILTLSTTQIINIFDNKQTNGTTTPQPPHPSKL